MAIGKRLEQIVTFVNEQGFLSVQELSELCKVSEVTIRRDLQLLDSDGKLRRTYGGATSLTPSHTLDSGYQNGNAASPEELFIADNVDVLIAPSFDPLADMILLDRTSANQIAIISESSGIPGARSLVAVDNYSAGQELGRWAGEYAQTHFEGQANVLDLGYYLQNTQARSQGFVEGLQEILPGAKVLLSINTLSAEEKAYQLTTDALEVHPTVNIIFAINDATAWGAIQACHDLGKDPGSILVIPFGLEGRTLKDALAEGTYCRVGLAMFPEIVGPVLAEAAITAYNHEPLPETLTTPFAVLTPKTLLEFYTKDKGEWHINWDVVASKLTIPIEIHSFDKHKKSQLPTNIGLIVPHTKHEWYQHLIVILEQYLSERKITLETTDATQHLKDEMAVRKRGIAKRAAEIIQPNEVLLIEHGQINTYLAEVLVTRTELNLTVITNSIPIFEILRGQTHINLILTGGLLSPSSQILMGPTAESALKELRADKLFLSVTGVSLDYGLSHTEISEVTVKQAMIRAAREIILLADHSKFGQESVVPFAPTDTIHKIIADNALSASLRLDLTQLGIEIILTET